MSQKETEMIQAYLAFWEANLSANMEQFSSFLVDDFSIFGTANGEHFFSRQDAVAFYTATADELKDKLQLRNRDISVQPLQEDIVIVRETSEVYVLVNDAWIFYGHVRVTCVIKKTGGEWKSVHQHASFPDHRTEAGQQLATEKIERENLELREAVQRRTVELQAKNRELEIEAAVERVRAQSMAMQQTGDLAKVNEELYTQISKLNIDGFTGVAFYLVGDDGMVTVWDLSSPGSMSDVNSHTFKFEPKKCPNLGEFVPIWEEGKQDYFIMDFPVERLLIAADEMEPYYKVYADYVRNAVSSGMLNHQWNATALITNGILSLDLMRPPTEEVKSVTLKMAAAFNLAYQRFLDLQRAEAAAKETVKQAALDRIRADIASMRTVNDLDRITPLIWNELTILGIPFIRCGVFIMDEEKEQIHTFLSTPDGKAIAAFHIPYHTPGKIKRIRENWNAKTAYTDHWNDADFMDFAHTLTQQQAVDSSEQYLSGVPQGGLYLHFVPFQQGMLYAGNSSRLSETEIHVIQSVADAFSTAYARYEDFTRLEVAKQQVDSALNELQSTQKQLIQSEKMASLGELTAGIAHEIQNPLNFVNNFSEVSNELIDEMNAELDKGDTEEAKAIAGDIKQNLEKINHHGKRADAIVKGMLQHSRTSSGQRELTDINALCDEYLRLAYHGLRAKDKNGSTLRFNATFETDFDDSLPKINVVPQEIGRVILNLINNAFYAVNEKKKTAGAGYAPTVSIATRKQEEGIEIRVKDNGNGIPEAIKDKIFQPFFTTKPTGQGTGLGLSMSYDIVKAHGGVLRGESGNGTLFSITLPEN